MTYDFDFRTFSLPPVNLYATNLQAKNTRDERLIPSLSSFFSGHLCAFLARF